MESPLYDNDSQGHSHAKSTADSLSLSSQVIDTKLPRHAKMINIRPPVDQSSLTIAEIISENKNPLNIPLPPVFMSIIKAKVSNSKRSRKSKKVIESSSDASERSSLSNKPKKQRITEENGEKIIKKAEKTIKAEKAKANITSSSFTNKKTTSKWTVQESRKFLKAIELFGTDFSLILGMFPERSRTQLKVQPILIPEQIQKRGKKESPNVRRGPKEESKHEIKEINRANEESQISIR